MTNPLLKLLLIRHHTYKHQYQPTILAQVVESRYLRFHNNNEVLSSNLTIKKYGFTMGQLSRVYEFLT